MTTPSPDSPPTDVTTPAITLALTCPLCGGLIDMGLTDLTMYQLEDDPTGTPRFVFDADLSCTHACKARRVSVPPPFPSGILTVNVDSGERPPLMMRTFGGRHRVGP